MINFGVIVICVTIIGLILRQFSLNNTAIDILRPIIGITSYIIFIKKNENENSIGWIVSKKLVKSENCSLGKTAFLIFCFIILGCFYLCVLLNYSIND